MVWDGNEILRYKKTVSIKQTRMFLKVKFRSGYNKKNPREHQLQTACNKQDFSRNVVLFLFKICFN